MIRTSFLRSLGWAIALCSLAASLPGRAQAVKDLPKPTDYVSDFAHVMSPQTIRKLDYVCGEVDHEAHAQIAVVTVETTDGEPIQEYAVDLEDAWKVGPKASDRGLIIVIAVKDRKRFISTGYGLEPILPDALVGQIGRQMVPMLRANDFDGALTLAVDETSQIIAKDANIKLQPLTRWGAAEKAPQKMTFLQVLMLIVFVIFIVAFLIWAGASGILGFLLGMFFGGGFRGGGGFGGGGGDGDGGDGFGGFGGGSTGGGGAGGSW